LNKDDQKWIPTVQDIDSVDWKGQDIKLSVPVELNEKRGIVRIHANDIIRAEQKYTADKYGLSPSQIFQLLLLYAEPRFIKRGYLVQKSRMNKMLFYLRERMQKLVYGKAYVHDEIVSGRAGPIPKNLKKELIDFQEKGLIELSLLKNGERIAKGKAAVEQLKPGTSLKCELTENGGNLAKSIWDNTPDDVREIVLGTKEEIFALDPQQLREKVHRDYPQYKRTYIDLDDE
jgi:hypothetical protein